jgi:branched-chain amino acid transport system permease protein
LLYFITQTPLGRHILALRENTHRLRFLGYNVHTLGTMAFALSAMFSGVAGGLQAISIEASNYAVFDMHLSAEVVLNAYIGGVQVFFGPVIGAAVMTFLGNSISDVTRNWFLYKGILFVLVMMYMPTGIAGLANLLGSGFRKYPVGVLVPALLVSCIATLLLLMGMIFTVEMMQRVLSQDYQMMAQATKEAGWPPIVLFGREWLPNSMIFWLVPLGLFLGGGISLKVARGRWKAAREDRSEELPLPSLVEFGEQKGQPHQQANKGEKA